ncbi:MAG: hypothetical protein Q8O63_03995, partial [Hoeflea sp.]|nr:hypothetical protein [Hoeflea sp.]
PDMRRSASAARASMQAFRAAFDSNILAQGRGGMSLGGIRAKRHVDQSFFDRHVASATSRLFRSRGHRGRSSAGVTRGNVTIALRRDVDYISQSIYIIQDLK